MNNLIEILLLNETIKNENKIIKNLIQFSKK